MKFVRFQTDSGPSWGLVEEEIIHELSGPPYACHQKTGATQALAYAELLAPIEPTKIIGIGVNYKTLKEANPDFIFPERPRFFYKPLSTITAPEAPIIIPPMGRRVCFEGEMAFVLGKKARYVSETEALKVVFGVTCTNEVSDLELVQEDGTPARSKCFDTFFPAGPYLVTGLDPNNLVLRTRLNGVEKQHANTRDLLFNVQQIISYLSQIMTLYPGDVISTGTPPGLDQIKPGDVVEVEIEGVGVLRNPVA